ncbi:hypothetical protein ACPPVO_53545 [Dactylosporangium sp. McL0621]|uniref:hypothetical protein n=1 Tax=Dactylosporangium sp. McL0621 TaxID=3415678 RepID=UPI003CF991F3
MWRAFLVAAAVSPVALWDDGPVARLTNLVLQGAAVAATAAGLRRNRPGARRAWRLLWAALALGAAAVPAAASRCSSCSHWSGRW